MKVWIGLLLILCSSMFAQVYVGSSQGLFVEKKGQWVPLWTNGGVFEILQWEAKLVLRTSQGIVLFDPGSKEVSLKNRGLKTWTIQDIVEDKTVFLETIEPLMDLAIAPDNPLVWVACSKSTVYFSTNAGETWHALFSPTYRGWVSVAIHTRPRLTLWAGHALNGIFLYEGNVWKRKSEGLFSDTLYNEEISSIVIVPQGAYKGVWAVNNFFSRLYRYEKERWEMNGTIREDIGFVSGLVWTTNGMLLSSDRGVLEYKNNKWERWVNQEKIEDICARFARETQQRVESMLFDGISLQDLWCFQSTKLTERQKKAYGKVALYLPPSVVANARKQRVIFSMMEQKKINALVIDLKDDWGDIRFLPKTSLLQAMAKSRPLPLDVVVKEAKKRDGYLIARIVLFQDRVLYSVSNFLLASWDKVNQKPWQGIKTVNGEKKDIQEYWVDSYHPLVWRYNLAIAQEALALGFDEIQFDYVRFPTDGENLKNVSYRAKGMGMTPESMIYSFFRYVRKHIEAPISMDIYGANGWYRTSLRTYQEIDLLKEFVDVFCPMYYPSHFDQGFMAYPPAEQRPYRIYYYGSLRNSWIVQKRSLIRPYVQAFKIGVSYDRKYYGEAYIRGEINGCRDGLSSGYTFWNMGGDYQILTNLLSPLDAIFPPQ